ncbi:MAG: hypothetical protein U5O16_34165 [Rhodococcus sp. (in: high G+C Gram-positive bacteria)]|uniref:hypothetical protein n=1 Tax=Rhodococcus sp. TaxID=1831 RepID=UPI002ADB8DBB|nr:hypothetical protein [Rhodococcus sp. (in: high G+C Gram-positive bacteria)]
MVFGCPALARPHREGLPDVEVISRPVSADAEHAVAWLGPQGAFGVDRVREQHPAPARSRQQNIRSEHLFSRFLVQMTVAEVGEMERFLP